MEAVSPMWNIFDHSKVNRDTIKRNVSYINQLQPSASTQIVPGQLVRFEIQDMNSWIPDSEAYLTVKHRITTSAGGVYPADDAICIENGCPLFVNAQYSINNQTVEQISQSTGLATNVQRLLSYSSSYEDSFATSNLWYPDTFQSTNISQYVLNATGINNLSLAQNAGSTNILVSNFIPGASFVVASNPSYNEGFAKRCALYSAGASQTVVVPLNELFPFLKTFRSCLKGYKRQISFQLDQYANFITSEAGVALGAKLVIDEIRLYYPIYTPSPSVDADLLTQMASDGEVMIEWESLEVITSSSYASGVNSLSFPVGNIAYQPTKILFGIQLDSQLAQDGLKNVFQNFNLTSCSLKIGSAVYPYQGNFQTNFPASDTVELYSELTSCTGLVDLYGTGLTKSLSRSQWQGVYPLVAFNLRDSPENQFVGVSPSLVFNAQFTPTGSYRVVCFLFSWKKAKLTVDNSKILIVFGGGR